MTRRYGLRDDQWNRIEGLLPGRDETVGVTAKDNRLFVEAVLDRYRAGIPWRDWPERFGDWKNVHRRPSRWAERGVWEGVFRELAADADNEYAMIDRTIVRAHQHSAGAQKKRAQTRRSDVARADYARKSTPPSMRWAIRPVSVLPLDKPAIWTARTFFCPPWTPRLSWPTKGMMPMIASLIRCARQERRSSSRQRKTVRSNALMTRTSIRRGISLRISSAASNTIAPLPPATTKPPVTSCPSFT